MRQAEAVRDVTSLIKARNTILWIVSGEERRVEGALADVAESLNMDLRFWDCVDSIQDATGATVVDRLNDPMMAIGNVRASKDRALFVFRDMHQWMDKQVVRSLRSLGRRLQGAPKDEARAVIILAPSSAEIPTDLVGVPVIPWPLPDRDEMGVILDDIVRSVGVDAPVNGAREAAIDAAVGLSADEAANSYAKSLVTTQTIDPAIISIEKKRVIDRERVLTWHEPDPRGLDAVGGLDVLKSWLIERKSAFSPRAREYGLQAPKGVFIVGHPGTGKSLTAKSVATAWGQPLLRLDLGALKSKFVGESEENIRKALDVAETVAPCVLWIDEIEKALAGAEGPQGDGGVSSDALGVILNWMQERAGNVFVVATANSTDGLPAALLRKGRFDELFFVDLPTVSERREILVTAIAAHGRNVDLVLSDDDVTRQILLRTDRFVGAEIAAAIPDAMFRAFSDGERELTGADVLDAVGRVTPLSSTASEEIEKLKAWGKTRATPASSTEATAALGERTIEM